MNKFLPTPDTRYQGFTRRRSMSEMRNNILEVGGTDGKSRKSEILEKSVRGKILVTPKSRISIDERLDKQKKGEERICDSAVRGSNR